MDLPPLPRQLRVKRSEDPLALAARLVECGVADGHPVIPPTRERIEAMLVGWDRSVIVGALAPLWREVTVEDVAVCAVMAGSPHSALPALVAAAGAVQHEAFNLLGVTTTTGSAAIGMVLHGDVVETVGASAGGNCLGPGRLANASMGRALATVVRAGGAALPGKIDVAIMGQPAKFGLCFAELPPTDGWPNLHQERGLPSSPGAVTVLGLSGTLEVVDATSRDAVGLLDTLAASLLLPLGTSSDGHTLGSGEPVAVLPPEWVARLGAAGWSKDLVRERLWERAQMAIERLPSSQRARAGSTAITAGVLRIAENPGDITLLVAGGPGTKATLLPLWPGGSRSVTVPIADPKI